MKADHCADSNPFYFSSKQLCEHFAIVITEANLAQKAIITILRCFSLRAFWLTRKQQRKVFIPFLEVKCCKINKVFLCVWQASSLDMFTPPSRFEEGKSAVRGNKYPSVRDRKQLPIWKQTHLRGSGAPQLAAKHQVRRGAGGPTSWARVSERERLPDATRRGLSCPCPWDNIPNEPNSQQASLQALQGTAAPSSPRHVSLAGRQPRLL